MLTSPYFRTDIGENFLNFNELKEFFKEEGNDVELHTVSYYFDENGDVSYDLLGFDALLLFDGIWYEGSAELTKVLTKFVNQGGKILGVCAIDEYVAEDWYWIKDMQPFFGIKPDVYVRTVIPEDEQTEFNLLEKPTCFKKNTYNVHSMRNLCPRKIIETGHNEWEDWNEDHLLPGAKYIANSDQIGLSYIQYGSSVFLYTGLFLSYSFEECPDTYLLFKDMLRSMFESNTSITIEKVERIDDQVLYTQETASVQITVRNSGNETISNAAIHCNGEEIYVIEELSGKSYITIPVDVVAKNIGENDYRFTINALEDTYSEDNASVLTCNALETFVTEEELFVELEKNVFYPVAESIVLEGKAFPGTFIKINELETDLKIPVNEDGSFSTIITPEHEIESLQLVPVWKGIAGKPLQVTIHWMESCQIYFQIGNSKALINGSPQTMDQSALIINGRTMVPLSFIVRGFRASIGWGSEDQSIRIKYLNKSVTMQIGNPIAVIESNGEETEIEMDCPALIMNGRTMVPIRFLADIFNSQIEYDSSTESIYLAAIRCKVFIQVEKNESSTKDPDIYNYEDQANLNIFDFKNTKDGLFLATPTGIHRYNNFRRIETIPYKTEWYSQNPDIFDSFKWGGRSEVPYHIRDSHRSFLEVDEFCIVICLQTVIHVLDMETYKLLYSINGLDQRQKLVPEEHFERVYDLRIIEDYIYANTDNGLLVFDKYTGTCVGNYYINIGLNVVDDYLVGVSYTRIIMYNLRNHQARAVEIYDEKNFTDLYVKDDETITLFQWDGRYYVEVSIKDVFTKDELKIRERDIRKTDNMGSLIQVQSGKTPLVLISDYVKLKTRSNLWCVGLYEFNDNTYRTYGNCFKTKIDEVSKKKSLAPLSNYVYKVPEKKRYILDYSDYYLLIRDVEEDTIHVLDKNRDDGYYYSPEIITKVEKGQYLKIVEYKDEMCCFSYDFNKLPRSGSIKPHVQAIDVEDVKHRIDQLSMCNDYYCVYETSEQSVIFLDKKEGSIKSQRCFYPEDTFPFNLSRKMNVTEMCSCGNTVYLLDVLNKCIYPCDYKKGFKDPIQLQSIFLDGNFCNLIVDEEKMYLLHSPTSRIAVLEDGVLQEWILPESLNAKMIRSFDLCDGEIVINDFLQGGIFAQPFEIGNSDIRSAQDIIVSSNEIHLERYPYEDLNFCVSLQLIGDCQNVSIDTSPEVTLKKPIKNISSQVLNFSLDSSNNSDEESDEVQEETIVINADGFTKEIKVFVKNKPRFVAFFDQSIFCSSWKGIFWNKSSSIVNKEGVWIDTKIFQDSFECVIRYSREKIYIDFNGKTIESDLNGSNYIYASSNGKRYMREGKLWITNENDIKLINADIFAEEAQADGAKRKDSVYYYGNVVK